jgi:hypothetical protein
MWRARDTHPRSLTRRDGQRIEFPISSNEWRWPDAHAPAAGHLTFARTNATPGIRGQARRTPARELTVDTLDRVFTATQNAWPANDEGKRRTLRASLNGVTAGSASAPLLPGHSRSPRPIASAFRTPRSAHPGSTDFELSRVLLAAKEPARAPVRTDVRLPSSEARKIARFAAISSPHRASHAPPRGQAPVRPRALSCGVCHDDPEALKKLRRGCDADPGCPIRSSRS